MWTSGQRILSGQFNGRGHEDNGASAVGQWRRPGPELVEAVRRSCREVADHPIRLAESFYYHLFRLAPAVRPMFPADLGPQTDKLCRALLHAMSNLDRPGPFEEQLARLGAIHHRAHGVKAAHYPVVGRALVGAVRDVASVTWSPSTCAAWVAIYEWLAWHMIRGAAGAGDQSELPAGFADAAQIRYTSHVEPPALGPGLARVGRQSRGVE
jgi:hemoglobin-like flavoprotein